MSIHHITKDCVPAKRLKMSIIESGKKKKESKAPSFPSLILASLLPQHSF
jgi:hypothetical protein